MTRGWLRGESGQATVEFALLLTVLLLLAIGIIEMGRAWSAHQVLTEASRDGARRASVANPTVTSAAVDSAVRNALVRASLRGYGAGTTVTLTGWRAGTGTSVSVRVDYAHQFLFLRPLMRWTTGQASITMTAETVMRNE